MNKETIKNVLINEISSELKIAPKNVDEYATFTRMGVSSVQALTLINHLRKELSIYGNPVALFEFNTVDDISAYLAEEIA